MHNKIKTVSKTRKETGLNGRKSRQEIASRANVTVNNTHPASSINIFILKKLGDTNKSSRRAAVHILCISFLIEQSKDLCISFLIEMSTQPAGCILFIVTFPRMEI